MAANERATLRLVNPDTGEISEEVFESRRELEDKINGLLRTVRMQSGSMGAMQRELNEVKSFWREHRLFPAAERLFALWRSNCKHRYHKSERRAGCSKCERILFTEDRFEQILPHLREPKEKGVGEEICRRAIEGAAYDPYTKTRRNGTVHRFNEWEFIFRNRDKVEDFANRAPYHLPDPRKVSTLAQALVFVWGWEVERAVEEAQRRLTR